VGRAIVVGILRVICLMAVRLVIGMGLGWWYLTRSVQDSLEITTVTMIN